MRPVLPALLTAAVLGAACAAPADVARSPSAPSTTVGARPSAAATATAAPPPAPSLAPGARSATPEVDWSPRPSWLGTRVLPLRPDGYGEVLATPDELRDRRLASPDVLPPPAGAAYEAVIGPVPAEVARRSTWREGCPVELGDLRYVTVTFWGFDERAHTGELLLHQDVAEDVAAVFRRLFAARFPVERMAVVAPAELDAPPTGDGNNTTAFVCRPTRGSASWSEHAYGLAIDVNPFHNPYVARGSGGHQTPQRKGDLVLPELASAYTDRDWQRPGMVRDGDVVVDAFAAIGWEWGGDWERPKDWMHFSRTGR